MASYCSLDKYEIFTLAYKTLWSLTSSHLSIFLSYPFLFSSILYQRDVACRQLLKCAMLTAITVQVHTLFPQIEVQDQPLLQLALPSVCYLNGNFLRELLCPCSSDIPLAQSCLVPWRSLRNTLQSGSFKSMEGMISLSPLLTCRSFYVEIMSMFTTAFLESSSRPVK